MAKTKETRRRGLLGSLRALFGATEEPVKVVTARKTENDHWVDLSRDQLLGDDPTLPVHIVTLHAYRLSLGAQWAKVEGRVMMLAESVVRRVGRHGGVGTERRHGQDKLPDAGLCSALPWRQWRRGGGHHELGKGGGSDAWHSADLRGLSGSAV